MTYIVIVSVVTVIFSIPLIVLLTMLLQTYCSKWPGAVANEDLITEAMSEGKSVNRRASIVGSPSYKKQFFGEAIKIGVVTDSVTNAPPVEDVVQYTYNGKTCRR